MKITARQFVSNNKDKGTFATVFKHFAENSENKTNKEGDLYCLVSISGSENLPAERVSKFVWDGILDGYLYSSSKSTNDSLKDAITEGVRKLKDLMKNDKSLEELGVNVDFVLVAQKKEGIYIGNLGENEIFVFKEGKFVNISEILGKSKASTAGIALVNDDILMVSTKGLITSKVVKEEENAQNVLEQLRTLGRQLEDTNGLIYFSYEQESKPQTKEPEIKSRPTPTISKLKKPIGEKISLPRVNIKIPKIEIENEKVKEYWLKIKKVLVSIKRFLVKIWMIISKKMSLWGSILWGKLNEYLGKKKWFKKLGSRVSEVRLNRPNFSPKGMRIDGYRTKDLRTKRIKQVVFVIAIIVLLALGINLSIKAKKAGDIHKQASAIFTDVEGLVKKAENSSTSDESTTETVVFQAKSRLGELNESLNEKDRLRKSEFEGRILAVEDFMYNRVGLSDNEGKISTFVDARLTFGEGSDPTDLEIYTDSSSNQYLLVTDKGLGSVFRVALYDKALTKVLDTDNLIKSPMYLSMGNTGAFVYDTKTGVVKASFDKNKNFGKFEVLSGLGATDIKSKNISELIVLTSSDNVYLLSKDDQSLMKSVFSEDNKYGLLYKYLSNVNFANATDVLADLSVYVLTPGDDGIIRYSYSYVEKIQKENPLSISGVDGGLGNVTKGFTKSSLDYGLYVFDARNKRLMKFEKPQESSKNPLHPNEILLKKQYVYRGTKSGIWDNIKDIVVDSQESTMYILDGTVIWKLVL